MIKISQLSISLSEAQRRWYDRMSGKALLRLLRRRHSLPAAKNLIVYRGALTLSTASRHHFIAAFKTTTCSPFCPLQNRFPAPTIPFISSFSSSTASQGGETNDEDERDAEWEEEEEAEPKIGDGGDGGGIVLGEVSWGELALSAAREILDQFGDDVAMFAFKVSPRGYIYVRLDKLTNKYGCPAIEEIEKFNILYKQQLDEIARSGEVPDDLALEVSSPGAERLLKVPDDLGRFKEMPMLVNYVESVDTKFQEKDGVFMLELIEDEIQHCIWKLADVKENRAAVGKGRPLSRKMKDWRLRLPFDAIKRVQLYLS